MVLITEKVSNVQAKPDNMLNALPNITECLPDNE